MKCLIALTESFFSKEGTLFRYSISYGILLGIFPGLFVIVMIIQNSSIPINQLIDFAVLYFPKELIFPFFEYLLNENKVSYLTALLSFVTAVFVSSQSIYSFLLFSTKTEKMVIPSLYLRVRSVVMFLIVLGYILFAGSVLMFFPVNALLFLYLTLFFGLYGFYRSLSFYHYPWKYGLFSSLLTAFEIEMVGLLFFWYIESFITASFVYGPLSSILVLFLSSSVLSNMIYLGYCMTLLIPCQPKKKKWIFAETSLGKRLTKCFNLQ